MFTTCQPSTCHCHWWWGHGALWGLVIGPKKLAEKKERGNVPVVYLQKGELVYSTDVTGSRDAVRLSKKKTEPGTNKAQLNLTQHG